MAQMKLRFEKSARFSVSTLESSAERLGICSITQWDNMEREGGGNIVATRIARGHKYHFDLPGCEADGPRESSVAQALNIKPRY